MPDKLESIEASTTRNSSLTRIRLPQIRSASRSNNKISLAQFSTFESSVRSPSLSKKPMIQLNNTIKEVTLEQFYDTKRQKLNKGFELTQKLETLKKQKKVICFCGLRQQTVQGTKKMNEKRTNFQRKDQRNLKYEKTLKENQKLKEKLKIIQGFNDELMSKQLKLEQDNNQKEQGIIQDSLKLRFTQNQLELSKSKSNILKEKLHKKDLEIAALIKTFEKYRNIVVESKKEQMIKEHGQFIIEQFELRHDEFILNEFEKQKKIEVNQELENLFMQKVVAETQIKTLEMAQNFLLEKYSNLVNQKYLNS